MERIGKQADLLNFKFLLDSIALRKQCEEGKEVLFALHSSLLNNRYDNFM